MLLRPEEQVFEAMLDGWRAQQLARNLAPSTIGEAATAVARVRRACGRVPVVVDGADGSMSGSVTCGRSGGCARSTLRTYALAVSPFCRYVTDPAYGWAAECQARFGTHPVQVFHEWNTAVHVQDAEADPGKRAFTVDELQAFFDHADDQVRRVRGRGRKGWLPAFRDAALFKVAYGFGLRRTEAAMLDLADFGANPHAPSSASSGSAGSASARPARARRRKRRSVLTVWPWVPGVLAAVDRGDPAADAPRPAAPRRCGRPSGRRGSASAC